MSSKHVVDSVYDATRAFDKNRKVNVYLEEEVSPLFLGYAHKIGRNWG